MCDCVIVTVMIYVLKGWCACLRTEQAVLMIVLDMTCQTETFVAKFNYDLTMVEKAAEMFL
jgi:hypothetical protein